MAALALGGRERLLGTGDELDGAMPEREQMFDSQTRTIRVVGLHDAEARVAVPGPGRRIHDHEMRHFVRIRGGVSVRNHQSDIVADEDDRAQCPKMLAQ